MAAEWRDRALEHSHVLVLADGLIELTTPPIPSIFIYIFLFLFTRRIRFVLSQTHPTLTKNSNIYKIQIYFIKFTMKYILIVYTFSVQKTSHLRNFRIN
jgi:hypothetical protein